MLNTTRRNILKLAGASVAALSLGDAAVSGRQLPGQPSANTPAAGEAKGANVMAIAAHPGDAFFAMGAPVALATHQGGHGSLLSLSLGEKGSLRLSPAEYGAMQKDAAQKAAGALGATALFLPYPDGGIPVNDEIAFAVCDLIRQQKPHVIVTHWKGSWHKDHSACYDVVQNAIFYAGVSGFARELPAHNVSSLFFADNWEDAHGFEADTYLDIAPIFDRWLNACDAFPMWRGENGFRYNDYYASRAVQCGCLSQVKHAVSLMSPPEQRVQTMHSL